MCVDGGARVEDVGAREVDAGALGWVWDVQGGVVAGEGEGAGGGVVAVDLVLVIVVGLVGLEFVVQEQGHAGCAGAEVEDSGWFVGVGEVVGGLGEEGGEVGC